jgi:hypothetical protein
MAKGLGLRVHKEILDCYFNATDITSPATSIYVSLHTADPGETASTGANDEVTGGSYARIQHSAWDTAIDDGGVVAYVLNDGVITFDKATADWGTVTHAGIWTHLTTDTDAVYLGRGELSSSRAIPSGDTASFADNAITVQITETA